MVWRSEVSEGESRSGGVREAEAHGSALHQLTGDGQREAEHG